MRSTTDRRALGTTHGVADAWCTTLMTFVHSLRAPRDAGHRWAVEVPSRDLNIVTCDGRFTDGTLVSLVRFTCYAHSCDSVSAQTL